MLVGLICNRTAGCGNSSCIVNRKEIVLGFASHYFTPSYLQCSHYLSQILQPAILLHKHIPVRERMQRFTDNQLSSGYSFIELLSILSGFCGGSTSLQLEKHYILVIKSGLTKQQFQVCSEVSDGMEGCVDIQLREYH